MATWITFAKGCQSSNRHDDYQAQIGDENSCCELTTNIRGLIINGGRLKRWKILEESKAEGGRE